MTRIGPNKIQDIRNAQDHFPAVGTFYEGTAIFAPSSGDLARVSGVDVNKMNALGTSLGSYGHLVEAITGLKIVHRGGVVVGQPIGLREIQRTDLPDRPIIPRDHIDVDVDCLVAQIESLEPGDRKAVLARLAIENFVQ